MGGGFDGASRSSRQISHDFMAHDIMNLNRTGRQTNLHPTQHIVAKKSFVNQEQRIFVKFFSLLIQTRSKNE